MTLATVSRAGEIAITMLTTSGDKSGEIDDNEELDT